MSYSPTTPATGARGPQGVVHVGTWNCTAWSAERFAVVAALGAAVLALQETKLARIPLEHAQGAARTRGYTLHHGAAVPATRADLHGERSGVAFLTAPGVAVAPLPPQGAAWRRLHGTHRLHGVVIPRRPGLPHGMRIFTVYAPLRRYPALREAFDRDFLDLIFSLDLAVPTLVLGDFNGSVEPERDTSAGEGPVCPLLARLLGPGAPLLDLQLAISPEARDWTFHGANGSAPFHSRIDLILGTRSVIPYVVGISVRSDVVEGGHSPVVAALRLDGPIAIDWCAPRPRLPAPLRLRARELQASEDWRAALERWGASAAMRELAAIPDAAPVGTLAASIEAALQSLVHAAGGWSRTPARPRRAYDSGAATRARAAIGALGMALTLLRREQGVGTSSVRLCAALHGLRRRGLPVPASENRAELLDWAEAQLPLQRRRLAAIVQEMRRERLRRWRGSFASLWGTRPRAVYRWLAAEPPAWGTAPILDAAGMQCTSREAVDREVRAYWVERVWGQHAGTDAEAQWAALQASPYFPHFPTGCAWPLTTWTAERVQTALQAMRADAAPGPRGIPLPVWRALPLVFLGRVAALFTAVEREGTWPPELLHAYVTMIPKAAGGTRPQDQRPITVLDVLYRVWAKGTALAWAPVLQQVYLGPTTLGFRAQAGTMHLAQLLGDVIGYGRRTGRAVWLASFDIAKCYPSLPWWAVFGILEHVGVPVATVRAFRSFYTGLRARFRYGQVEGAEWGMANGLAQGCPASPDLLNIVFEGFHRWAVAQGVGFRIAGRRIASASFADDMTLLAGSPDELAQLAVAFVDWAQMLGLAVNVDKTQVWTSVGTDLPVTLAGVTLRTRATFRVVGVELGGTERGAAAAHAGPRLAKAYCTAERLRALPVPPALTAHLWQAVVLAQALYGCEVCLYPAKALELLGRRGNAILAANRVLDLAVWRAPEVLAGWPLGACAVVDPRAEACDRRARWCAILANESSLVGTVHRFCCCPRGVAWTEQSAPLVAALRELGWTLVPNPRALRAREWPVVEPESAYRGAVRLLPDAAAPPNDAAWTDGSVPMLRGAGGAAVVQLHPWGERVRAVPCPRSSLHCELVALQCVQELPAAPSLVLTDSLNALELISQWGAQSTATVLDREERVEVRRFLHAWRDCPAPPTLEKVKAHNEAGVSAGQQKAIGNALADRAARAAAAVPIPEEHDTTADLPFEDAVRIRDHRGQFVHSARRAAAQRRWELQRAAAQRRGWLRQIYPEDVNVDWTASRHAFRMPTVVGVEFVHTARPAVLKWLARTRAGALNTGARCVGRVAPTAQCMCCPEPVEDDAHALTGCPATGAADWQRQYQQCWTRAGREHKVDTDPLPDVWLQQYRLLLAVALIPEDLFVHAARVPLARRPALAATFHLLLAERLAETLRRREELGRPHRAGQPAPADAAPPARPYPAWGVPERQLSAADLRRLEQAPPPPREAPQPLQRRRGTEESAERRAAEQGLAVWLRQHPHIGRCPVEMGEPSPALLLLWEADHGRPYPSDATTTRGRLTTFSKRLAEAVEAHEDLQAWVQSRLRTRSLVPGIPPQAQRFWSVRVLPSAGPAFLTAWKAYLEEFVLQRWHVRPQQADPVAVPPPPPASPEAPRRPHKRAAPPLHTKAERVKRLRTALQAASANPGTATIPGPTAGSSTDPPAVPQRVKRPRSPPTRVQPAKRPCPAPPPAAPSGAPDPLPSGAPLRPRTPPSGPSPAGSGRATSGAT